MTVAELKEWYKRLCKEADEVNLIEFTRQLVKEQGIEYLEFHYSLLAGQKDKIFYSVRGVFDERKDDAKAFLLKKIVVETDPVLRREALFMLGLMRCTEAKDTAIEFVGSTNDDDMDYGITVLGWLGKTASDIDILEEVLLGGVKSEIRVGISGSLEYIWHNNKKNASKILRIYNRWLAVESNDDVNRAIISGVQEILKTKFGITVKNHELTGNVAIAKQKAIAALNKFFSN